MLRVVPKWRADRINYSNKVVRKPWGHEFQIFDDGRVSIWMLYIKPKHGTSIHCHFSKDATFIPLVGSVTCTTNDGARVLRHPASMSVDRYTFHSVRNAENDDLFLIEVETPSDKADLFRLRDDYGRRELPYEGSRSIVRDNIDDYGHFELNANGHPVSFKGFRLSIVSEGESNRLHIARDE